MKKILSVIGCLCLFLSCNKMNDVVALKDSQASQSVAAGFYLQTLQVDDQTGNVNYYHIKINPTFKLQFSKPVDTSTVTANIQLKEGGLIIPVNFSYQASNSLVVMKPKSALKYLTKYTLNINSGLTSAAQTTLGVNYTYTEITTIDSSDKFPRISNTKLLNLLQKNTFNYFWIAGHPLCGMAKERFSSDVVTTGGTGFAIMSVPVAIERNFITRAEGLARVVKIANFLDVSAQKYHGAFAHWLNGNTGATIPFSAHDDGADLVETSYLMEGLLTARQYFNGSDSTETNLRKVINKLYKNVEWDWFRNGQNTLYWHWSPNYGWDTYQQVNGWNEALITYVMAASSPKHTIDSLTYANGWARNGAIVNGNVYYGVQLPLGPSNGGPLFFEHYSFMGINPNGLTDPYANYQQQTLAHTQINYNYCVANPGRFNGYSDSCWGLTASDDNLHTYSAHEPNNDDGVLTPTAALSS
ncbi:MAG TPA: glucoamylase family protein, partial [Parafilimonas sp.]|nr:glucoamylase family protein [Parafilimonas sp.]